MKKIRATVLGLSICLAFTQWGFADNPIIQTNYTADPAPMVHNDTVFLYTSHDEDDAQGFKMNNWMLYTSTDLVNWTDHGIIASLNSFSWQAGSAWAPQCVERNGKFYMYCPLNSKLNNNRISVGVLVSNSPYGPFTDPLGKPLITDTPGANDYDPTAFVDDDGQAYLSWGGNGPCMWAKLNEDMISVSGSVQKYVIDFTGTPGEAAYTEGPWYYKKGKNYYLAWASRCCPEGIGYAMGSSFAGPWKCKGVIMAPNARSSGNHPGLMDFKGKSYVFGFDYELLFTRIPYSTSKPERRSICLKEMTFNADGSIKEVPWWGAGAPLPGVPQVDTLSPYDRTQAETICWEFGVRTEICKDSGGGMDVDSIHNGDFIKVKGLDFGANGATSFEARVASATSGGNIEIHVDTTTGPLLGTCAVTGTGGWQTWTTKSCTISGVTGVHDLFFKFTGGSGLLFNFNWWKFTRPNSIIEKGMEKRAGFGDNIKAIINKGKSNTLRLNFSQPVTEKNLNVCLFNLSGRLVRTLFTGTVNNSELNMNLSEIRSGAYVLKILSDDKEVLTKTIALN
jgi:arabinoxylan arabinofuranohydrolase